MKAILASHNKKKIVEMQRLLRERIPGIELISPEEAGIAGEAEETGITFEENALLKAHYCALPGYYVFADDSGLEVDALNGRPGVFSARYAGEPCNDGNNNVLLLSELEGVPAERRTGRYVSVIACLTPEGEELTTRATCEGVLLTAPQGNGGFGYDPLFYVPELCKTFAEVTPEEKDAISHRGRAVRLFLELYADKIKGEHHADK